MRRRSYSMTVRCHEPGCAETGFFQYDTREEESRSESRRLNWKCLRHSSPNQVVDPQKPIREWISEPSDSRPHGTFWGSTGFLHGPGFIAWAKDFPVGTRLKVTVEALPPNADRSTGK